MNKRESNRKNEYNGSAAMKDPLTGIYNRNYFTQRLPVELLGASIHHIPFSVIHIRLCNIAQIETAYGYSAGDTVRLRIVELVVVFVHKGRDWPARYSDRDFVVCMPGKEKKEAAILAESLRQEMKKSTFGNIDGNLNISLEIHVYSNSDDSDSTSLIDVLLRQMEE